MIFGFHKVEVENIDSALCWHVYRPKSNDIIVKVHYKNIFETENLSVDLCEAVKACLSCLGMPRDDVLDELFSKFPDLKRVPSRLSRDALVGGTWKSNIDLNVPQKKKKQKKKKAKQVQDDSRVEFEEPVQDVKIKRKLNL
ncbi:MAG: hypothetical protein QNK24_10370 [Desulfuromusa sp.]|nr:hypothetical protein [Desulfuromusa sp.]